MSTPDKDTNKDISKKEETKEEEKKKGGFGIWKIIIAFVIINYLFNYLKSSSSSTPKLKNIFTNRTKFDIHFYLEDNLNLNKLTKDKIIYTIKDREFAYSENSQKISEQTVEDFNVSITRDISSIIRRKNNKHAAIYLISEIVLKNDTEYNIQFRKYKVPASYYFQYINIYKYVEDLSNVLFQQSVMDDDMPVTTTNTQTQEAMNEKNSSNSKYVPQLYYKNTFTFYFGKFSTEEPITTFQEFSVFKMPFFITSDYQNFIPIMTLTDFWSMNNELIPINKTKTFTFNLTISFRYIGNFWLKQLVSVNINDRFMENNLKIPGTKDMLVELIKNNSPFYLGVLFTVNFLHSLFSFLGFSSDISYYKNLKRLDGVYTKY
ncbi:MAG: CLPTM1 family protein, partial [archaeon]|nr:CLPTM1 family protein [archaeon]